ncbi:YheU family protein [Sandaracinus amylolyticus]|uniref:Uncharacterized protein n=1 Tax=Sandaracinus amylolyticus TaxID=927083 RepID=A0A0F6VZA8_9BACT|nr:YheU family protein [Sandaracinus amylolyticus]AKF03456.1 hypothetical protein DB32_000605 [Sandaracinus amylolyticus]
MSDDGDTRVERDEDLSGGGDDDLPPEVEVPWERLSPAALRGVIEEFVTREGTEYGERDVDLETKVAQVKQQLERGEVVVLFDAKAQSVNLVRARDLRGRR